MREELKSGDRGRIDLDRMKVLMLGWEYPPHIAGGLGTACEGLTKGLARHNVEIVFVVPQLHGDEEAVHMQMLDQSSEPPPGTTLPAFLPETLEAISALGDPDALAETVRISVPAFLMPYWTEQEFIQYVRRAEQTREIQRAREPEALASPAVPDPPAKKHLEHYGHDMFDQVAYYTERVTRRSLSEEFDIIHAHDWMTYPAGVAIKHATGKPLVVHVHSLEFDRSGQGVNPRIHQIEGFGLTHADAVITVSHYTKSIVHREHGVPLDKIHVVHNGIYDLPAVRHYRAKHPDWPKHIVLFLGRVTFQKGPEYFVRAAAKVIPHIKDVLFVLAGSGDMLEGIKRLVIDLGIEDHFYFPGFVRGKAVEEMYSMADLYVMPSVSEPFGITALEAINFETPVLLSRQSGASEVLGNALKADFWDIDRMADLIINALIHDELRDELRTMAKRELKNLRWDASAVKIIEVYRNMVPKEVAV